MARPKSSITKISGIVGALPNEQQESILAFLLAMTSNSAIDDEDAPPAKSRKEKAAPVAEKKKPGRPAKVVEEDEDDNDSESDTSHADIIAMSFDTLDDIQEAMSAAFADDEGNLSEDRNDKRFLSFMKKMHRGFTEEGLNATKELREVAENLFADVDALLEGVGPRSKAKVLGNNLYACALVYMALSKMDDIDELLEEAGYSDTDELSDHDKIHYVIAAANGLTFEDEDSDDSDDSDEEDEEEAPTPKKKPGRPAKVVEEDEDDFDAPVTRKRRAKV